MHYIVKKKVIEINHNLPQLIKRQKELQSKLFKQGGKFSDFKQKHKMNGILMS